MSYYKSYKTKEQLNVSYGSTFSSTGKAPVIANRIWETLTDVQGWIEDPNSKAVAGLVVTVLQDYIYVDDAQGHHYGDDDYVETRETCPGVNGVYMVQYVYPEKAILPTTDPEFDDSLKLVKLSNSSDVNATIGEMNVPEYPQANINTTFGENITILTIESIQQTNGVIGAGDLYKTDIAIDGVYDPLTNKIATQDTVRELNTTIGDIINTVIGEVNTTIGELTADDISARYNPKTGYSGPEINTVQGAITDMTERIEDLEGLPTYETVVCSTAQNTPLGVTWENEQGQEITGLLSAGENTLHKIYLVRQHSTGGDIFDEYITVKTPDTENPGQFIYSWEKIGSTAGVFEGIEEVADGLEIDATVNTAEGHYMINANRKLVQATEDALYTYTKSDDDGLTMASDVKGYVDSAALITRPFTSMGVQVGNIGNNYHFEYGMTLNEIMEAIFRKIVGAERNANPSLSVAVPNADGTAMSNKHHEVGKVISDFTVTPSINNAGKYKSKEPEVFTLSYGKDGNGNRVNADSNGILTANCTIGTKTINVTNNNVQTTVNTTSGVVTGFTVIEGTNITLGASANVNSNVTPYKNDDTPDTSVTFNNYPISATGKNISGRYKFYLGICQKKDTIEEYRAMFPNQASLANLTPCAGQTINYGWCENIDADNYPGLTYTGVTNGMGNTSDKTAFVLVLPEKYNNIKSTNDNMNNPVDLTDWKECNTFDYVPSGGDSNNPIHYHLRVYPATGGDVIYQNIVFTLNQQN